MKQTNRMKIGGTGMNFDQRIDAMRADIIKSTQEIVQIKSVEGEAAGDMPFGEGVQKSLEYVLDLSDTLGFNTKNVDNYAGHADFGDGEETLGLLVHIDVVPEGDNWDYPPYGAEIHNNRLYGRGTIDDKGPAIAALYAMKAVMDSGIKLNKKVRMIIGTNEETHWKGINYYLEREKAPDLGFTPDAEFPAIHGEKGILIFNLLKKFEEKLDDGGIEVLSIKGGTAPNAVPDYCEAHLKTDKEFEHILIAYNNEKKGKIELERNGNAIVLKSFGVAAHGSTPEKGVNSIAHMLEFLNVLDLQIGALSKFIRDYSRLVGMDLNGERLGCAIEDEQSGKLVLNVGEIDLSADEVSMAINIRYPVTEEAKTVYDGIKEKLIGLDITIEEVEMRLPLYVEKDNELVVKLMDVYRQHSGDTTSEPITIGGGTYARAIKNAVAFGPLMQDMEETAHQRNEYIDIDHLIKVSKIYAHAIYALAK